MPNNFLELLISFVAVWRISYLLIYEEGPFLVFKRIRDIFHTEERYWNDLNTFGKIFSCINCMSIYISALIVFLLPSEITYLFALSGFVIVLNKYLTDGEE